MDMQEMIRRFEYMEKRLSALEDIEEIKRLQTTYVNFLQEGNYNTIEDFFTEDALFTAGPTHKGKKAIGKYFREVMVNIHSGKEGDILVQPVIDLDGDKATGKWVIYFLYYHPKTYQLLYFVHSYYDMGYLKVDGKWKISRINILHNIEPPGGPPSEDTFLNFLDKAQKTMQEIKIGTPIINK